MLVGLYSLSAVPDSTGVGRRELLGAVLPPLAASLLAAAVLFAFDRLVFGGQPHADVATLARLGAGLLVGLGLYVALMLAFARHTLREFVDTVAAIAARTPRPEPS